MEDRQNGTKSLVSQTGLELLILLPLSILEMLVL